MLSAMGDRASVRLDLRRPGRKKIDYEHEDGLRRHDSRPVIAVRQVRTNPDPALPADPHPLYAVPQPRNRFALPEVDRALEPALQAVATFQEQVIANRHHVACFSDRTTADREILELDAFGGPHSTSVVGAGADHPRQPNGRRPPRSASVSLTTARLARLVGDGVVLVAVLLDATLDVHCRDRVGCGGAGDTRGDDEDKDHHPADSHALVIRRRYATHHGARRELAGGPGAGPP
jgi:hypothetical protein